MVRTIDTRPDADGEQGADDVASGRRYWRWYVRPRMADDDGSWIASQRQELEPHLRSAEDSAIKLVTNLGLDCPESSAIVLAAKWHDRGKRRAIWQRSIGNSDYPKEVLAKTGGMMWPHDLNSYRHEFGSLVEVSSDSELSRLAPEVQDLVLHLIAAHHGRARPHFPADEVFDPENSEDAAATCIREVPRCFARLQRKYGRWGLAYLESLVRAADALASQSGDMRAPERAGPSNMMGVLR
jgi:CRISPR-associated endonuclease/helicase Cas3